MISPMKLTRFPLAVCVLLLGSVVFGFINEANAFATSPNVRIYSVTYNGRATFSRKQEPVGNSFRHRGFLIYNAANPVLSQTVVILPDRRYRVASVLSSPADTFFVRLRPDLFGLESLDLSGNGRFDTEVGFLNAFFNLPGGLLQTRSVLLRGSISKRGFRVGSVPFPASAKTLRFRGSEGIPEKDFLNLAATLRTHKLNSSAPMDVDAGTLLVTEDLDRRGYQVMP
jgi:hypothetical protein